ncbi:ABC transporter permease [Fodinicurvata sp. EGI_FJ10296]|uniref:ABC transporter permease n=1 Tax=Fodinicurvata sp. EGI_FJ10296 TaxID=3231908 RepID=UPI003455BA5D
MTAASMTTVPGAPGGIHRRTLWTRLYEGRVLPVVTVLFCMFVIWIVAATWMNMARTVPMLERTMPGYGLTDLIAATWSMDRPVLPTPFQVGAYMIEAIFFEPPTGVRSLVYHSGVTMASTIVGFVLGTGLGIIIAIGIVHVRTLDRSLMPWVIASQTVPILAIAPMIVVVLGNVGFTGIYPKAVISAYLSFFPVTIGMVKGLRAPDPLQMDLMRTYNASRPQILGKLRWPSSLGFLFPSLKVAIALSLVGAIVGELPTGAQAGIGARLLIGSYYGQMTQIWGALITAGLLAMLCILAIGLAERLTAASRGGRL